MIEQIGISEVLVKFYDKLVVVLVRSYAWMS